MSGRIRTVKPEWLEDELLNGCSSSARVLSMGLICLADDYGNGRASDGFIGSRVFEASPSEAGPAMRELENIKYVVRYRVDGQTYYSIRNWQKHQRVDKPGKPKVPGPDSENAVILDGPAKVPETHAKVPESPENPREIPALEGKGSGRGSGRGGECEGKPEPVVPVGTPPPPRPRLAKSEPASDRAFRLPDDWRPNATTEAWLREQRVSPEEAAKVLRTFSNHWGSKGGKEGRRTNWDKVFENWVQRDIDQGKLIPEEPLKLFDREPPIPPELLAPPERMAAIMAQVELVGRTG